MNVHYRLHDILFEWHSEKDSANLNKHGVTFQTACEVFFDPFVRIVAEEFVNDELREAVVGMTVDWRFLYVVYVMRDESVRLISARPVTTAERREYED